jgi:hypothetical protein
VGYCPGRYEVENEIFIREIKGGEREIAQRNAGWKNKDC